MDGAMPCGHHERELAVVGSPSVVMGAPVSDLHWFCMMCDFEGRAIAQALMEPEVRSLVA